MNTFYEGEAHLTSQSHETSHLFSNDGRLDLTVSNPLKSKQIEKATNPEQLFAGAFVACFENAMVFKAMQMRLNLNQYEVKGKVGIGSEKNRAFHLTVHLQVGLPGLNRDEALALIEESQKAWPFTKASDGGIQMQIELVDRI